MDETIHSNATPTNDILHKLKMPGETVRVPSAGLMYDTGVLDPAVTDGEIYVYPMSSYDEIILKTPDKLFSGNGIIEVLNRCVPQIQNVKLMLIKDIEFIIAALRRVTYGNSYTVTYTHSCSGAKSHEYNIDLQAFSNSAIPIDPVQLAEHPYELTMPNGQLVKLTPIRYGDFVELEQLMVILEANNSQNEDQSELIDYYYKGIAAGILNIDGNYDKNTIIQWCKAAPAKWVNNILDQMNGMSKWGLPATHKIKCKDCKQVAEVQVNLNPMVFFSEL